MAKRKMKSPGTASTREAVVDRPATDSAVGPAASTPEAVQVGDEIGAGPYRGRAMPASDGQGEVVEGMWDPRTGAFEPLAADSDADGAGHPVTISVPLGPPIEPGDEGTCPRHVDVQLRYAGHRSTMRRVFTGLDLAGARTANGNRVSTNAQAVLWLLEQIDGTMQNDELGDGRGSRAEALGRREEERKEGYERARRVPAAENS